MGIFRNLLLDIKEDEEVIALPSEYQRVEYIQSSSGQYINTQYLHKTTSRYEFDFAMTSFYAQYNTVFGGRYNHNTSDAIDFGVRNNNIAYINVGKRNPATFLTNFVLNTKYNIVMDTNAVTVDGTKTRYVDCKGPMGENIPSLTLSDGTYSIYLFALNQQDSKIEPSNIKLYSFKIFEGDDLKMNFIPCYRKSDNTSGMYDVITMTFFNGSFTLGPNVEE